MDITRFKVRLGELGCILVLYCMGMVMRFLKIAFLSLLFIVVVLVLTPFALVKFGPPAMATNVRVLVHAISGYSEALDDSVDAENQLTVAEGFSLNVYASKLGKIRFLFVTEGGDLLVSRPRNGDIIVLERDKNGDGLPDGQRVLLDGLTRPQGIDYADGWLYIAESNAVGRIAFDNQQSAISGSYQRIVEELGDKGNHWTKTIRAGDDGWLYLSSGSTCNVCEEVDDQRATIMRLKPDGSELTVYASGLRNSVGMDWAPWSGKLFATDNGRDLLGDDFPPCELNQIEESGFYGWPYVNASTSDPDMGSLNPNAAALNTPPAHEFRAHNAPLGMRFLRHNTKPKYQRTALVALHGSWNRSIPDGYKVVALQWDEKGVIHENDFVSGFLHAGELVGRPVDVAEAKDGSIYISDDYSGTVYRVVVGEASSAMLGANVDKPVGTITSSNSKDVLAAYSDTELMALTQSGAELYGQLPCASCHEKQSGAAINMQKVLVNLSARYTVKELGDFFLSPTPPMPVFSLDEAQREALAMYLMVRDLKSAQ